MPITQSQIDALLATTAQLDTQVNALVADAGPPPPPVNPTVTLAANPQSVVAGSPSTLTWGSTDAVGVAIDQGVGAVASSGTQQVTPAATTNYTATATGAAGTTPATAQALVTVTAVVPPTGGPLATLAPGKVRDLGAFANPAVVGGVNITDDCGFVYDPVGKRMLQGPAGGHGPYNATNIRQLDLQQTLLWTDVYPSKTYASMLVSDLDVGYGRWTSTNDPTARHNYRLLVPANGKLFCMAAQGMPYQPSGSPDVLLINQSKWGGRLCWYDFATGGWTYSKYTHAAGPNQVPWASIGTAACWDAQSGKILVSGGPTSGAGLLGVWSFDPVADLIATVFAPWGTLTGGLGANMVRIESEDKYEIVHSVTGTVRQFTFNRANPTASTVVNITVTGMPQQAPVDAAKGLAYDPGNDIIGGAIVAGIFNAYHRPTKTWLQKQMVMESAGNATVDQKRWNLDFDTDNACFIFNSMGAGQTTSIQNRTFAYRYAP